MRRKLPKPGDILQVGVFGGKLIVGHYIMADEDNGPLVQFYACPVNWVLGEELDRCAKLYQPLYVGLNPPVRLGRWAILGGVEPTGQADRKYLMRGVYRKGDQPTWWLYDNGRETQIGAEVPNDLQNLEVLSILPWQLLEERFEFGHNPLGYKSTMERYEQELAEKQTGLR